MILKEREPSCKTEPEIATHREVIFCYLLSPSRKACTICSAYSSCADNLRHPRESRGIRSSNRFDLQDITNDTENQDDTIEEEAGSTNVDKQGKVEFETLLNFSDC